MKKWIALLLAVMLLLSGCSNVVGSNDPGPTGQEEHTSNQLENIPSNEDNVSNTVSSPMITVSVPVFIDETTATDGTVIFRNIRQSMQLVMPDQDVADKIIIDFLSRIELGAASSDEVKQQAQVAYVSSNNWIPYLNSISYAPKRIDQSVLSLYGSNLQFDGGAHAENTSRAANYNVLTGDVLTLGSIVVEESSINKLCNLVITKLQAVADEKYLRDGFEQSVKQRFNGDESTDESWYFSATGLCFYFDQYAIAPYSSGVITVEIPYAELIGIIDDAFFPPELDAVSGSVKTISVENADVTRYTRICEVVLENEAPMRIVYTEGTVQNLRIVLLDAVLNGEYTVFATPTLTNGDAVVIQANTNMFRQLIIVYESNGREMTIPVLD